MCIYMIWAVLIHIYVYIYIYVYICIYIIGHFDTHTYVCIHIIPHIGTAYCIWIVIESQSPISISLVSFQRNVGKETRRTRSSIEI